MKKKHLSNKDIKQLNQDLQDLFGLEQFVDKKSKVELLETDLHRLVLIDSKPSFFYLENKLVPTLRLLLEKNILKTVTVDMPAVPFMAKGADVMRPGITEIEEFAKDQIVAVVDEKNHKPLCIGRALFSSQDMTAMERGKVIKSLHHVGDKIWTSG